MTDAAAGRIRRALDNITANYDLTLEPVRRAPGSHVQTSGEAPLPISANILDARALCRERMANLSWRVIRIRDLHTENLSILDVPAMADLIGRHADWIAEQPDAGKVLDDLEDSAHTLEGIAAPHRREWQSLGPCPLVYDDVEGEPAGCPGTIRAYPESDPYCDACGTEAVVSWWERMQFPDAETSRLLTATELVVFVHKQFGRVVTGSAIRKWVERGIVTRAGTDDKGRALYDRAAVAYALERHQALA